MAKNNYPPKYRRGERIPTEIDLRLAQSAGNAKSINFFISALSGSLESELDLLQELLRYCHKRHLAAHALMTVVKRGQGADATVWASGLEVWVDIEEMPPRALVRLRVKCRKIIRQMAWNKGVHIGRGHWEASLREIVGQLKSGRVASEVKSFRENIREDFLTSRILTNGVIQYRISKSGAFESAEVDFSQEPMRIKFTEAAVPEPEVDSIPGQLVV